MDQRDRMLRAVVAAVAERGYAHVTVGDVVSRASVSRRTFYEHFTDKQDCFLAAYRHGAERLAIRVVTAGDARARAGAGWEDRLRAGLQAYAATHASDPRFARTLLVDVLGAGQEAVELRGQLHELFVERFAALSREASEEDPSIRPVPRVLLRALVGGISELVTEHILTEGGDSLRDLTPVLVELCTTVLRYGGQAAGPAVLGSREGRYSTGR